MRSAGGRERSWLVSTGRSAAWLVELDAAGAAVPADGDVPSAYPTDIELSLPARCITDLVLTPDRRRVHPDADLTGIADGYVALMRALPNRPAGVVPRVGLARNDIDAALTGAVLAEVAAGSWLPTVADGDVSPRRAECSPTSPSRSPTFSGGGDGWPCVRGYLGTGPSSRVARGGCRRDRSGRYRRPSRREPSDPRWWRLYDALSPVGVRSRRGRRSLGALPVPRADGRLNFGARGLLIPQVSGTRASWILPRTGRRSIRSWNVLVHR